MEFGSDYVYHYDDMEYEYISDEELEDGMNVSSSGSDDSDDEGSSKVSVPLHPQEDIDRASPISPAGLRGSSPPPPVSGGVPPPPPPPPVAGGGFIFGASQPGRPAVAGGGFSFGTPPIPPVPQPPPLPAGAGFSFGAPPVPPVPPPPPVTMAGRSHSEPAAPSRPRVVKGRQQKKAHHWRTSERPADIGFGGGLHNVPPPPPLGQRQHVSGQRVRQADTNVVSIKFDKLIAPSSMHAGDPQVCESCSAILSKISKITTEGEEKFWDCEFCDHRNSIDLEEEEIPTEEDVTFMLEPALSTTASGPSGMDEALVVFCVDISGSMCVTTEVPGHVALRGAESLRRAQRMNRDREDQFLPRQRRDVTYVSRLQSVQAAIDHQLQEMEKEFPNRRVALVTFNSEVTVIGDGKSDPVSIAGDKLGNKDTLKTIAGEQTLPAAVKTTRKSLGEKLFELEEGGPTALGPALLVSTTMAAKFRGSKVILCTDGLANVGMGKLDNFKNDAERDECIQFYEDIADSAADNGVSISVITIKGTDCRLVELGKMADKTGGQVNIVDPLKLTQEFSTILANKIIATNVVATFILHKELFFFYEETEESKVVRNIGNVTADTEITFEYGVRTKQKPRPERRPKPDDRLNTLKEESMDVTDLSNKTTAGSGDNMQTDGAEPISEEPSAGTSQQPSAGATNRKPPSELPFQLQVVYTDTEGAKAMRLLTKTKPVTKDRQQAERACNLKVLGAHTAQTSANLALEGQYTLSRQRALMNQRVAWRHTETDEGRVNKTSYKNMFGKIKSMENYLGAQQKSEVSSRGRTYSDSEDDEDDVDERPAKEEAAPAPRSSFFSGLKKGLKKKKQRSSATSDSMAEVMYKGKSAKKFFEEPESD